MLLGISPALMLGFCAGLMDLDGDEPRKFQGPADRIVGRQMWVRGVGGGQAKILFGKEI